MHRAGEGAARQRGVEGVANKTADVGTAAVGACDDDVAAHVLERELPRTVASHHAAGMSLGAADFACRVKVLDGGAIGVAEGSGILTLFIFSPVAELYRVAVAVEDAAEDMIFVCAHHPPRDDVIDQFHIHAI